MKKTIAIMSLIAMVCPVSAFALTGISIGAKVGSATYKGEVLPASDDVGNGLMYGAIIEVSTLPILDFEFHANYFKKDFAYSYDVVGYGLVTQEFEFTDFNILALAKKNLNPIPMSPLGIYIGGGLGWHVLNTAVGQSLLSGQITPQQVTDPAFLIENTGKLSAQGLLGLKLKFPVMPLSIYGEGRYGQIFADESVTIFQIEAGAMLSF